MFTLNLTARRNSNIQKLKTTRPTNRRTLAPRRKQLISQRRRNRTTRRAREDVTHQNTYRTNATVIKRSTVFVEFHHSSLLRRLEHSVAIVVSPPARGVRAQLCDSTDGRRRAYEKWLL